MSDKYVWQENDIEISLCIRCQRNRLDGTCEAFPRGIPKGILVGDLDHTKPIDGDGGLQFKSMGIDRTPVRA